MPVQEGITREFDAKPNDDNLKQKCLPFVLTDQRDLKVIFFF